MSSLTLIIPAYNEAADIKKSVETNLQILAKSGIDYEVVIINDGSTDETKKIIEDNFITHPKLVFHSKENGGIGSAIKAGIAHSTKEYILFIPVDSPLSDEQLSIFINSLNKADVLVSYRVQREGYSQRMKANSALFHFLISFLFGMKLKDYTWIHLYKRSIFTEKGITIDYKGIFMLPEVLIKAKQKRLSFYEFPITMMKRENGSATAASYKAAIRTFRDTFDFYYKFKILRKWK